MCQCAGWPRTNTFGDCTICGAGHYDSIDDFHADIPPVGTWADYCHGDGQDDYGNTCTGYAKSVHPCTKCAAQNRIHNSAGFVESEGIKVKEMKEVFPVTITAYRGEKAFKVYGVIESSIASKPDREGNVILSFETLQSKDEIGYIPCVDWYTTELES
ncbi:hypothetical protein SEA_TUNATARTARE_265 [Streptomyces phage TunaTartare]|uniref:Uncharacterized protein n=1 Tax=Streptomyces phage TunaTartare TaxID=2848887 RepID=A0A8F2E6Z4_9CAUD|nr:hypothetical protein PP457_gp015 [Streptomyces phage TunaTartare]QWT30127.1 hypothetical protein SEA_TUNATARTARE_265 [Streptomyces phage TunaTartare]